MLLEWGFFVLSRSSRSQRFQDFPKCPSLNLTTQEFSDIRSAFANTTIFQVAVAHLSIPGNSKPTYYELEGIWKTSLTFFLFAQILTSAPTAIHVVETPTAEMRKDLSFASAPRALGTMTATAAIASVSFNQSIRVKIQQSTDPSIIPSWLNSINQWINQGTNQSIN